MCWICWNLNVQVKMLTAKAPQHVVLYSSPGWNHCGRKLFHQQVQRIIVLFSSFVFFLFSKKSPRSCGIISVWGPWQTFFVFLDNVPLWPASCGVGVGGIIYVTFSFNFSILQNHPVVRLKKNCQTHIQAHNIFSECSQLFFHLASASWHQILLLCQKKWAHRLWLTSSRLG